VQTNLIGMLEVNPSGIAVDAAGWQRPHCQYGFARR
jgi:hypothetical protein